MKEKKNNLINLTRIFFGSNPHINKHKHLKDNVEKCRQKNEPNVNN